ncbi:hypothetical protein, partial [Psychrobacter pacificensis]|uniref:hypothetical protein n=1 Tax=Psychrobacter pacificensis TaxID=112002 RepID=UPI003D02458C
SVKVWHGLIRLKNYYYAFALTDFFVFLSCAELNLLFLTSNRLKNSRCQCHGRMFNTPYSLHKKEL